MSVTAKLRVSERDWGKCNKSALKGPDKKSRGQGTRREPGKKELASKWKEADDPLYTHTQLLMKDERKC